MTTKAGQRARVAATGGCLVPQCRASVRSVTPPGGTAARTPADGGRSPRHGRAGLCPSTEGGTRNETASVGAVHHCRAVAVLPRMRKDCRVLTKRLRRWPMREPAEVTRNLGGVYRWLHTVLILMQKSRQSLSTLQTSPAHQVSIQPPWGTTTGRHCLPAAVPPH